MSLVELSRGSDESGPKFAELELRDLQARQGTIAFEDCHAVFDDVSYYFRLKRKRLTLLANVSVGFPKGRKIALLGHKGVGKSTLLQLLGERTTPTRGRVHRKSNISWPLNSQMLFSGPLSVRDNLIFAARTVLGQKPRAVLERAVYFAELDLDELSHQFADLSSPKRRRLGLALGLMAEFDMHIFDGPTQGPAFGFSGAAANRFAELVYRKDYLITVPNANSIPKNCDLVYILYQGQIYMFEDIELAKRTFAVLPAPVLLDEGRGVEGNDGEAGAGLEAF